MLLAWQGDFVEVTFNIGDLLPIKIAVLQYQDAGSRYTVSRTPRSIALRVHKKADAIVLFGFFDERY